MCAPAVGTAAIAAHVVLAPECGGAGPACEFCRGPVQLHRGAPTSSLYRAVGCGQKLTPGLLTHIADKHLTSACCCNHSMVLVAAGGPQAGCVLGLYHKAGVCVYRVFICGIKQAEASGGLGVLSWRGGWRYY